MDLTPPTAVPCTCGEIANGTRTDGALCGRFDPSPMDGFRKYVWDACPRHGGFEVSEAFLDMRDKLGTKFYDEHRPHFDSDRSWMWKEGVGYRRGTEPPWEPKYYLPSGMPHGYPEMGYIVKYWPNALQHKLTVKRPPNKKDFTPVFSTPDPNEPTSLHPL